MNFYIKKIILFTVMLSFANICALGQGVTYPNVIPAVKQWNASTGRLNIRSVSFSYEQTPRMDSLMNTLKQELNALGVKVEPSGTKITLSPVLADSLKSKTDAYQLVIGGEIILRSHTYQGYLYATRTLLQLIQQNKTLMSLPKGTITDFTTLKHRMVMLDVARTFFPVEILEQYIRSMAWVKMNELHLHLNDCSWNAYGAYYRLPSEKYPQLTSQQHYSWDDIAHIVAFARTYGITVTPEIDTPGHSRALVEARPELKSPFHPKTDQSDTFLDITKPETIAFVGDLIAEIAPHFPAPDFHIGTDEYMLKSIKDTATRNRLGEEFRLYINKLNKVVRAQGKNTRIWTGFENMPGTTMPDTDITIDMWDSQDARGFVNKGYTVINSSDIFNYIVPGNIIKRYNTDHKYVYEHWNSRVFSRSAEKNLPTSAAEPSGAKLNIWNDYGPTGSTMSEIARQVVPSIMVFADRMWGSKKIYTTYEKWLPLEQKLRTAPLTDFTKEDNRKKGIVYQSNVPVNMGVMTQSIALGAKTELEDLEYPWTLEATVLRTARSDKDHPEVILSSPNATLYAYLNHIVRFKNGLFDQHPGITLIRAQREKGLTAYTSQLPQVLTFNGSFPIGTQVKVKIIACHNYTALYIDGQKVGEFDKQSILPLLRLGDDAGNNFRGIIQSMTIYNYEK
ncbi:MAG: glycoside hydrolase family 20 protein [Flavobacteriales bacterium]|nr:glycoside hydrolase family 20 protein [Flavobacteriales bacterium]